MHMQHYNITNSSFQRRACSYNDIVREIMWGMQNLMPLLIPQEQSVFTKADWLPICKGLDMLLSRHGINIVKQEWVSLLSFVLLLSDSMQCFLLYCYLVM